MFLKANYEIQHTLNYYYQPFQCVPCKHSRINSLPSDQLSRNSLSRTNTKLFGESFKQFSQIHTTQIES